MIKRSLYCSGNIPFFRVIAFIRADIKSHIIPAKTSWLHGLRTYVSVCLIALCTSALIANIGYLAIVDSRAWAEPPKAKNDVNTSQEKVGPIGQNTSKSAQSSGINKKDTDKNKSSQTAQIYKWVDEQGRTFYSSSKQEPRAELAKLPEIKRIKDAPLDHFKEGCKQHGGASCDRGADSDGSVICLDGFRESPLPFRFACSSARLSLEQLQAKGDKQKILIKNSSGVQGKSVAVKVSLSDGTQVFASGSQTIEPHALEEFEILLKELKLAKGVTLSEKDIHITCANCE